MFTVRIDELMDHDVHKQRSAEGLKNALRYLVFQDKRFFTLIVVYGAIVALLNLALPLSVQLLITSVIYTALISPVMIIGLVLLFLISFSALLSILQKFLIEIYKRNSFVRLSSEMLLKVIYSDHKEFIVNNSSDLSGRYFEIFNIQRNASELIVEGFLVFLTMLVSFTLSSFYHPYFFILNIIIVITVWLTWRIFSKSAINRAVELSETKFAVFAWIDDIFRMSTFFKSGKNKDFAINKGYNLINHYIHKRKKYWSISFTQFIILTVIYVAVTIVLITFGSVLVIRGQLSLGQLVAAEILYTTSMYGLSKLGIYFDTYYNLIASVDEMSHLLQIDNEKINKVDNFNYKNSPHSNSSQESIISFKHVKYQDYIFGTQYQFDFNVRKKSSNLLLSNDQNIKNTLIKLLTNLVPADSGFIEFNESYIADYDQHFLRDQIVVIDNVNIFGGSIREFLDYGVSLHMRNQISEILDVVGLKHLNNSLINGLDTKLVGDGYPLQEQHIILLKIAKAILNEPMVIILSEIFDKIDKQSQQQILNYIVNNTEITLICFSKNEDNHIHYDNFILLTESGNYMADNSIDFNKILKNFNNTAN